MPHASRECGGDIDGLASEAPAVGAARPRQAVHARCLMRALPRTQQMRIHAHDPGDPFWRISCSNPASQGGHRPRRRSDASMVRRARAGPALHARDCAVRPGLPRRRARSTAGDPEMPLMWPAPLPSAAGAAARAAVRRGRLRMIVQEGVFLDPRRSPKAAGRSPRGSSAQSRSRRVRPSSASSYRRCADPSHRVRAPPGGRAPCGSRLPPPTSPPIRSRNSCRR